MSQRTNPPDSSHSVYPSSSPDKAPDKQRTARQNRRSGTGQTTGHGRPVPQPVSTGHWLGGLRPPELSGDQLTLQLHDRQATVVQCPHCHQEHVYGLPADGDVDAWCPRSARPFTIRTAALDQIRHTLTEEQP